MLHSGFVPHNLSTFGFHGRMRGLMVRESSHSAVTFPSESNIHHNDIHTPGSEMNRGMGGNKMPPK